MHAIVYAVLIEGMYQSLAQGQGNHILYILCVTFLFKAEGIVKQIFNVRSVANTVGDLAASGAAAIALTQSISSSFRGEKNKENEDQKDLEDTTKKKDQLQINTAGDKIKNQVEKEERERSTSTGSIGSSMAGENSGTGGSTRGAGGDGSNPPAERDLSFIARENNGERTAVEGELPPNLAGGSDAPPRVQQNNTTRDNQKRMRQTKEMSDIEKARLVMRQKALKAKAGGRIRKIAKFGVRKTLRLGGMVAGLAVGAAQGDLSKAAQNAAILGNVAEKVGSGVTKVADAGIGRFAGARMRVKAERGDYKEDLRKVGVSDEFIEDTYNKAKGEAIRKALAKEMSGVRRGGKALGDVKFTGTMETETRTNS